MLETSLAVTAPKLAVMYCTQLEKCTARRDVMKHLACVCCSNHSVTHTGCRARLALPVTSRSPKLCHPFAAYGSHSHQAVLRSLPHAQSEHLCPRIVQQTYFPEQLQRYLSGINPFSHCLHRRDT